MRTNLTALGCCIGVLVVACGGIATQGQSGSSGADATPGPAPGAGGPCTMAGTYSQHFSAEPGGTNCPTIYDQTLTISPKAVSAGLHDPPQPDGGTDCSWYVDSQACSLSTKCAVSSNGFTTTASGSVTFVGDEGTGKEAVQLLDSTGDVISSCVYDISMTRTQ